MTIMIDEGNTASSSKYERQRHDSQEWEDQKAYVMYLLKQHTQEDAVKLLWENRRFRVGYDVSTPKQCHTYLLFLSSIRQFKSKIKEWGLDQNIKASDIGTLLAKQQKRKLERDSDTVFLYQGATLEESRLERFAKRRTSTTNATQKASPSARKSYAIWLKFLASSDLSLQRHRLESPIILLKWETYN